MNIELGIRLNDPNFDYQNISRTGTIITSFDTNPKKIKSESITKKSFWNKLFFLWSRKAINIANKRDLKIKHLVEDQENLIYSLFKTIYNEYFYNGESDNNFTKKSSKKKSGDTIKYPIIR